MVFPKNYSPIVYLSSEFALDSDLPTYAGGLGVLAGDLMKEAADENFAMVGIGILYKGKTFVQHITGAGKEEKRDSQFDHDTSFLRQTTKAGKPLVIELSFFGQAIKVKSYHIRLSDVTTLIFLSTDVDGNPPEWINDMDALYRGDTDSQIRQQILLGVAGQRVLAALGIKPKLYHINEGRPEFVSWELVADVLQKDSPSVVDAFKAVREKIVYTNHTLVSAGNLEYPSEALKRWAGEFVREKGLAVDPWEFVKYGDKNGSFSITRFALEISSKHSAVSKVHGKEAEKSWPDYEWVAITNGVHMNTWQDSDFRRSPDDAKLWEIHMARKHELAQTVLARTGFGFDPNRIIISWARRLAEYKQPLAIFEDITRLKALVTNPQKPVQLLYAGNSHSADPRAKEIVEKIIEIASTELSGHLIFIPNYNTTLANHLVSGSDVWLNTPKGNLEASGTSGMKAAANGVLNCTVVDGWTYEVDWLGAGWTLDPANVSESFYKILEYEIIPQYYDCSKDGLRHCWIQMMKQSLKIAENYSTQRMLSEYKKYLYGE